MSEVFFVSLGAILGANTRFKIHTKLQKNKLRKDFSILVINIFASFCLGLFLAFIEQLSSFIYSYQLVLFFSIGFLGSLSTFSSFVYELFILFQYRKFIRLIFHYLEVIILSFICFYLGFYLIKIIK